MSLSLTASTVVVNDGQQTLYLSYSTKNPPAEDISKQSKSRGMLNKPSVHRVPTNCSDFMQTALSSVQLSEMWRVVAVQ